jgi:ATP-dependent DNA helicase RecG
MEELELRSLILKGEDTTTEFKSKAKVNDPHDIAAECVAFLNKRGGTLLLGVEDSGNIDGFLSSEIEHCNSVLRALAKDKINPPVMIDAENVPTAQGIVIVVRIEEGIDKPYQTTKGGAFYIRSGDEKRHVSHRDELRRLFQVGAHVYAEQQEIKNSSLNSIQLDKYRDYYRERFNETPPEHEEDIFDHMRRAKLLIGNSLSLAGALLFAREPQLLTPTLASTRAVWFAGTDSTSTSYKADRSIEGTLPDMYTKAYEFLDAWNMRQQPVGGSFNDKGIPLVPPTVFEEILTNAFIHRDFFIPDTIKIFIFDDRIEIHSPGSLPNSLSLAEAMEGNSHSRNPIIEKTGEFLMKYRGTGTGLKRAKQLYPSIQFDNNLQRNAFIVTLPL